MKVNDKKELHSKEPGELKKMLKDGYELLMTLKLDLQQNKLQNTRGIYNTRKNIAIIKTILKGKEEQTENSKSEAQNPKQIQKTNDKQTEEVKAVKE